MNYDDPDEVIANVEARIERLRATAAEHQQNPVSGPDDVESPVDIADRSNADADEAEHALQLYRDGKTDLHHLRAYCDPLPPR